VGRPEHFIPPGGRIFELLLLFEVEISRSDALDEVCPHRGFEGQDRAVDVFGVTDGERLADAGKFYTIARFAPPTAAPLDHGRHGVLS
jgi:hypothetical protein